MPSKDHLGRTCGFLHIDEEDKKKKFEKRFFVINDDQHHLELYSNDPSIENGNAGLCDSIHLYYITNVDEARKFKFNHCFVINTVYRSYYVQAGSHTEMEEWMGLINDASKIIVPPEALRPHKALNDITEHNDERDDTSYNESSACETDTFDETDIRSTRTEIVGNVVVKKKISGCRKLSFEESHKPPIRLRHSVDLNRNLTLGNGNRSPRSPRWRLNNHSPVPVTNDKEIIKKGWISKQNRSHKTFKPRYVVLRKDGFLYYKSDRLDKEPLQYMPAAEILGAKSDDDREDPTIYDNLIVVITVHRVYYFQAESGDEVASWVNAFNKVVLASKKNKPSMLTFGESSPLSGSAELLTERRSPSLSPRIFNKYRKKSGSRLVHQRSSQNSIGLSTSSSIDSLDKIVDEEEEPMKFTFPEVEPTTSCPKQTKAAKRSSFVSYIALMDNNGTSAACNNKKSGCENFVATHLDPTVDNRSAVKPSMLKKKKTLGIIFSFNNMLMKKRERVQRELARQKCETLKE